MALPQQHNWMQGTEGTATALLEQSMDARNGVLGGDMPRAVLVSVIEDDLIFGQSMRRLMRSLGYPVEVFSSAADFLASPRLLETGCLISDVQMPAMSGLELHRHLVDAGHAIPTILMTAYPNDIDRTGALNNGVVCYLGKPIEEILLKWCLRAALGSDEDS